MVKEKKRNLSNIIYYSVISLITLALISFGVYALSPGVTPNPGHSISEVAPPTGCQSGQYLKWYQNNPGGNWECATVSSSTPTVVCTGTNKGLQWDGSNFACKTFSASSCPEDTTPYECYWSGWPTRNADSCYYSVAVGTLPKGTGESTFVCPSTGVFSKIVFEEYCTSGFITESRFVHKCPMPSGGICPPAPKT